ncbi:MAG: tetratricopeptide repeat protein [Nitrospinae bacterium]|nr:tetratricopeptide repeat protein [Nitrospinota bacterium]
MQNNIKNLFSRYIFRTLSLNKINISVFIIIFFTITGGGTSFANGRIVKEGRKATVSDIKTFQKEYRYEAGKADNKDTSKVLALYRIKSLLLEEISNYLESEKGIKNLHLTREEVTTGIAGIVTDEVLDETWDGKSYWLKVEITADMNEVTEFIQGLLNDTFKIRDLMDLKNKLTEKNNEIERLRAEIESSKNPDAIKLKKYNKEVEMLSAFKWFEKGYAFIESMNMSGAVDALNNGIALNPEYALAYRIRGSAYGNLGENQQEIKDLNRAIELNPKDAIAYYSRGLAYQNLGNYQQSLNNFTMSIVLEDHTFARAYYNRGLIYHSLGDFQRAIGNYKIAAKLGDKQAQDSLKLLGIDW